MRSSSAYRLVFFPSGEVGAGPQLVGGMGSSEEQIPRGHRKGLVAVGDPYIHRLLRVKTMKRAIWD